MAKCEFSNLEHATGPCGASLGAEQCVTLSSCRKDVKLHLRSFDVRDASINTEQRLILARAGTEVDIYLMSTAVADLF